MPPLTAVTATAEKATCRSNWIGEKSDRWDLLSMGIPRFTGNSTSLQCRNVHVFLCENLSHICYQFVLNVFFGFFWNAPNWMKLNVRKAGCWRPYTNCHREINGNDPKLICNKVTIWLGSLRTIVATLLVLLVFFVKFAETKLILFKHFQKQISAVICKRGQL